MNEAEMEADIEEARKLYKQEKNQEAFDLFVEKASKGNSLAILYVSDAYR